MSQHKYTDEQIVKALECCQSHTITDCRDCPNRASGDNCVNELMSNALDLINRQKVEIEEFEIERKKLQDRIVSLFNENEGLQTELQIYKQDRMTLYERIELVEKTRTKTVKEFAERVINLIYSADDINPITEWQIDNIVTEMTEGK